MSTQDLRIMWGRYSYSGFAQEYLSHYFTSPMSPKYHGRLFPMLMAIERHWTSLPTAIAAGREMGKTTCGGCMMPLHAIHYPTLRTLPSGGVQDLSKRYIVFVGSIQANAQKPFGGLVAELEENEHLQKDFGNFFRDPSGKRPIRRSWGKTAVELSTGVLIEAYGRHGKQRGIKHRQFRPDLVINDDVEDDKSVQSQERRVEDMDWFTRVIQGSMAMENGNLLATGTILHPGSLIAQLLEYGKTNGWNTATFPVYVDTPQGREFLWPERYGPAWLCKKQQAMPQSAIDFEYLQKPSSGHLGIGHEAFHYYKLDDIRDALATPRFTLVIGVDPACKTGERHDYTAIVPIARDRTTGIRYVLPATIARLNLEGKVNAIITESLRWDANEVGIESVQFQIALKEAVEQRARTDGTTIPTVEVKQSTDKKMRISRLFSSIGNGTLRFLRDKSHSVIVDQLINLYTCDHDDGADALEIANRLLDLQAERGRNKSGAVAAAL